MPPRVQAQESRGGRPPSRGRGRGRGGRNNGRGSRRSQPPIARRTDEDDDVAVYQPPAAAAAVTHKAAHLNWNTAAVADWLTKHGLGQYADTFRARHIDGELLVRLDAEMLEKDLKVESKLDRTQLLLRLEELAVPQAASENVDDFTCSICMEIMDEPVTLACGHTFDRGCLNRWKDHTATCPTDRSPLPAVLPAVSILLRDMIARKFSEQFAARKGAPARQAAATARVTERARREQEEQANTRAVNQIQRHFRGAGNVQLDTDTLLAILEMFQGDANQAIGFLELQGEAPADFVEIADLTRENAGVPRDYNTNPVDMPALKPPLITGMLQNLKSILLSDSSTYVQHLEAQSLFRDAYIALVRIFLRRGLELSHGTKTRCLAACWARHDREFSDFLLSAAAQGIHSSDSSVPDLFGVPEMLKAIKLLDAPRLIRAKEKRITRLERQGTARPKTYGQLRSDINDLQREQVPRGSLSGALTKWVRKAISSIPPSKLEYFALQLPTEPWKELCDLLHINPQHGASVDWFLPRVFGVTPPEDSIVVRVNQLDASNMIDVLSRWRPPYSFVRNKVPNLPASAKRVLAEYIPINQCLWWHHELQTAEVDEIIARRLAAGEIPTLPYGKLMERLMYFSQLGSTISFFDSLVPVAEKQLQSINMSLESPVVVLGDASFSMDVAIRASVIISSVLAVLSKAALRFFNTASIVPEQIPTSAVECLHVASITRADQQTAPAVALWEFYDQKKPIKTFIAVTDEHENLKCRGLYFHQLFYKYYTEVYPARLVFVSFLEPNAQGQMVTALQALGIQPQQFRFDARRPDLSKFDGLLGMLSTETEAFAEELRQLAQQSPLSTATTATATTATTSTATTTTAATATTADVPSEPSASEPSALEPSTAAVESLQPASVVE